MDETGKLIAVIGDEDTVTGFVLAGVGHRTVEGSNFLVVKSDTDVSVIEEAFRTLTARTDVGILLINQHVANEIRHVLRDYTKVIPTILGACENRAGGNTHTYTPTYIQWRERERERERDKGRGEGRKFFLVQSHTTSTHE